MQALKKITIGTINGKRGGFTVKEGDADRVVGRIFGRVDSVATKSSNYGDYLRFAGMIKAINEDREESFSPVLILPSPADSLLAAALEKDEAKMGVQFAFDIVLRAMPKKNPTDRGYEFIVMPLLDTEANDPLKAMQAALPPLPPAAKQQAALPGTEAPKAEEAQADAPTAEAKKSGKK